MDNAELAKWAALSLEDRNAVRRIAELNYRIVMTAHGIQTSVILLLILVPMTAVVLSNQSEVDRYTKTLCNVSTSPTFVYCAAFKPFCGRAEAIDLQHNRSVVLRFPSHSPALVTWLIFDVLDWMKHINNSNFTCYVRDRNGPTVGVVNREVTGLNGWRFAAGFCGGLIIFCVVSIMWLILRGPDIQNEISDFRRTRADLVEHLRWAEHVLQERRVQRWRERQPSAQKLSDVV